MSVRICFNGYLHELVLQFSIYSDLGRGVCTSLTKWKTSIIEFFLLLIEAVGKGFQTNYMVCFLLNVHDFKHLLLCVSKNVKS